MRTSGPGSSAGLVRPGAGRARRHGWRIQAALSGGGFTLVELLVVVAIIAFASAGVSLALRDSADAQLEREGLRLAALLETARTQSRTSGVPVSWTPTDAGFHFEGVADGSLPGRWLSAETRVYGTPTLVLGPEPIIRPQAVVIVSTALPERSVRVATDGLRPFAIAPASP